jgi:LacI family transcriptional regulator/LacI family repressor for deo operon, udp, cdd, tsx, nupC, and nupG
MPTAKIVSHAINLAVSLARDQGPARDPALEIFKPELIVRESTARPARAARRR